MIFRHFATLAILGLACTTANAALIINVEGVPGHRGFFIAEAARLRCISYAWYAIKSGMRIIILF